MPGAILHPQHLPVGTQLVLHLGREAPALVEERLPLDLGVLERMRGSIERATSVIPLFERVKGRFG